MTPEEMKGMLDIDTHLYVMMMGRGGLVSASCPRKVDHQNTLDKELGRAKIRRTEERKTWEHIKGITTNQLKSQRQEEKQAHQLT